MRLASMLAQAVATQCQGRTKRGRQCLATAKEAGFCHHHAPRSPLDEEANNNDTQ